MVCVRRTVLGVALAAVAAIGSTSALADGISDNVVKIGVLTDMSGQFSHESGEGSVTAVRMAITWRSGAKGSPEAGVHA